MNVKNIQRKCIMLQWISPPTEFFVAQMKLLLMRMILLFSWDGLTLLK